MATHGDIAEGGTKEEFSDIIKWRSGMFYIVFRVICMLSSVGATTCRPYKIFCRTSCCELIEDFLPKENKNLLLHSGNILFYVLKSSR